MPRLLAPSLVPWVSSPRRSAPAPLLPSSHFSRPSYAPPFLPPGFLVLSSDGRISLLCRFTPFPGLFPSPFPRSPCSSGGGASTTPAGLKPVVLEARRHRPPAGSPALRRRREKAIGPHGAPRRIGSSSYPTRTCSRLPPLAWKDPAPASVRLPPDRSSAPASCASSHFSVCSGSRGFGSRRSLRGELRPDFL